MKILIIDLETTISNNGHFADKTNKLVSVGLKWLGDTTQTYSMEYVDVDNLQSIINNADLLVGFNIKFDLHWLRNYGVFFQDKKIWDCQIAEFLFESQTNKYPSLNNTLIKYGLDTKLDVVKTEYWDKGVDTDHIPKNILHAYLARDLEATEEVFLRQKDLFKDVHKSKYKLFQLQCVDLLVLQDIEYNGLKFNSKAAREEATTIENKMQDIERCIKEAASVSDDIPINLNSNDHLSAILYGGTIRWNIKVPSGVFKTGAKVGQIKYSNEEVCRVFNRLVEPLEKTETAKSKKLGGEASSWSVSEDVLRQLKTSGKAKIIIDKLLEYGKMEKLKNTYLIGFSDLIEKKNWPVDMIYGNLNQCSVVTGRLSSTSPNLQNIDPQTKKFFESRYDI